MPATQARCFASLPVDMLLELTVENIAIIDRAEIILGPGMTALTGETGAGKSLVIDAIGLALGGRSDSDLVRAGEAKGTVWLRAKVDGAAREKAEELGVAIESDGELVIQREVNAKGGSSARLNGKPAPASALREIGALLIDMHGQHDHHTLLDPVRQLAFLDAWIGEECSAPKEAMAACQEEVDRLKRRLASLRGSRREREQRADMLRFQTEEIRALDPKPGESEELEQTLGRMQHSERLRTAAEAALLAVQDQEGATLESLGVAVSALGHASHLDPALAELAAPFDEALASLQDAARELRRYADTMDFEPSALELAAARLDGLKTLRRKYGEDEDAILAYLAEAEEELASLEGGETNEEEIAAQLDQALERREKAAEQLSRLRRRKAMEFSTQTLGHIRELAMDKAEFELRFEEKEPDADGKDVVSFTFSANPGEPMMPLHRVASGGELSRVMLAVKAASAGRAGVPTLIFDEVDTGLSGRAAAVMARKLRSLAADRQVIVISHLPQIAGQADSHWRIEKVEEAGRSLTRLTRLNEDGRLHELARMLAGETVSESALANARDLLRAP